MSALRIVLTLNLTPSPANLPIVLLTRQCYMSLAGRPLGTWVVNTPEMENADIHVGLQLTAYLGNPQLKLVESEAQCFTLKQY